MSGPINIDVRVENLLVRFTPSPPVDLEEAVERLGGVKNGDVIIKMLCLLYTSPSPRDRG